jgi:hypothetical protein
MLDHDSPRQLWEGDYSRSARVKLTSPGRSNREARAGTAYATQGANAIDQLLPRGFVATLPRMADPIESSGQGLATLPRGPAPSISSYLGDS